MGNIAPVHDGKCSFFLFYGLSVSGLGHQCLRKFEPNMLVTGQDYLGCFPHFFDGGEAFYKIVIVYVLL